MDREERQARLRDLAGDLSPLTLAGERRLPVLASLEPLFPGGGLQRGCTLAVTGVGATALVQAVLAGPTTAGSWAAWVGAESIGWSAAAELGVAMERIAVVSTDEQRRPSVLAALVDAFDLVVIGPTHRLGRTEGRRIGARARERGAVLLTLSGGRERGGRDQVTGEGADVRLECRSGGWFGTGSGWGHLADRHLTVSVEGRRGFDRNRRWELLLPGPDGVSIRSGEPATPTREVDSGELGEALPLVRRAG